MFRNYSIDVIVGFGAIASLSFMFGFGLVVGGAWGYMKGRKDLMTKRDKSFLANSNISTE